MFIGLKFLEVRRPDVLRVCISKIRSIVESCCESAQSVNPYPFGDLLVHLWGNGGNSRYQNASGRKA